MEVTAFIIELSAEVVKGIQRGNECWMMNNGKMRGEGRRDGARRSDGCAFKMAVEMTRFGATGGTGKTSDKCSFAKVVEMEKVDATGGASKARMP